MASGSEPSESSATLSAAARARMERQRLRARELLAARVPPAGAGAAATARAAPASAAPAPALDSGGGFLLEEALPPPRAPAPARHAPLVHASEQPTCEECGARFAQSYLFDTFECAVCDACRDDEGEHALVTRTEAKGEFLLQDCDLDLREPALRCVRRRNPHARGGGDMRLYLRTQVAERAHLVWGSAQELGAERARRRERAERARATAARKRLRALRLAARSSLLAPAPLHHQHRWDAERALGDDQYSRRCLDCGHENTYEKM